MYSYRGIVNDLLKEFPQISENYEEEIDRIKDTFQGEETAVSEDQEVRNLLQVTVLEYLRSWYLLQSESEKLMLPETKKIFECVKSYLREPPQDAVPWFSI